MHGCHPMKTPLRLTITWGAILKVLVAAALVYLLIRLAPLLQLLFLALLLAIGLSPIMSWLNGKGAPRWLGLVLCSILLLGSALLFFGVLVPTIAREAGGLVGSLPRLRDQFLGALPASGPVHDAANHLLGSSAFKDPAPLVKHVGGWATYALDAIASFFVMLMIALYLLADGPRVSAWLIAFLPPTDRAKTRAASAEITSVVSHYVLGQVITSVLCGLYAFLVLALLHVPNPLGLAFLAAVLDVLPLVGFFLFTIPAVAVAATVSPTAALIVAICYLAYKFAEDYLIVPLVYGNALRLSTLTVLISCLAAGLVGGVIGIIVILPIVASYPVIERFWLRPYLEPDTVQRHDEADRQASG